MTKADRSSSARHAAGAGVAVLGLTLAAAACGSSGGGTGSNGDASAQPVVGVSAITFHGTVYVSSQVNGQPSSWHIIKTFDDPMHVRSCAAAAKYGDLANGDFQVPSAQAPDPTDSIVVTSFHGPGTYPPATMKTDKSDTIFVPGKTGEQQYDITTSAKSATPGKEVLFLDANGSGEVVYSQAHLDGNPKKPAVAGLISWSCKA
jgi:hypothetical protein